MEVGKFLKKTKRADHNKALQGGIFSQNYERAGQIPVQVQDGINVQRGIFSQN